MTDPVAIIDRALADYEDAVHSDFLSNDAMRWSPPQPRSLPTPPMTPEQAEMLLTALRRAADTVTAAFAQLGAALQANVRQIADLAVTLKFAEPAPPDTDARERALWAAKTRHSGPPAPKDWRHRR